MIPVLSGKANYKFESGVSCMSSISSLVRNRGGLFWYFKSFTPLEGESFMYPHATALPIILERHRSSILIVLGETSSLLFILCFSIKRGVIRGRVKEAKDFKRLFVLVVSRR